MFVCFSNSPLLTLHTTLLYWPYIQHQPTLPSGMVALIFPPSTLHISPPQGMDRRCPGVACWERTDLTPWARCTPQEWRTSRCKRTSSSVGNMRWAVTLPWVAMADIVIVQGSSWLSAGEEPFATCPMGVSAGVVTVSVHWSCGGGGIGSGVAPHIMAD